MVNFRESSYLAAMMNIKLKELLGKKRDRAIVDCRKIATHILSLEGFKRREVGEILNQNHATSTYQLMSSIDLLSFDNGYKRRFYNVFYKYPFSYLQLEDMAEYLSIDIQTLEHWRDTLLFRDKFYLPKRGIFYSVNEIRSLANMEDSHNKEFKQYLELKRKFENDTNKL